MKLKTLREHLYGRKLLTPKEINERLSPIIERLNKMNQNVSQEKIKVMKNIEIQPIAEKIYRLMNHDSIKCCSEAEFESYSLEEYNSQFETCYNSIDEAVDSDPEYLFDKEQMIDFLKEEL